MVSVFLRLCTFVPGYVRSPKNNDSLKLDKLRTHLGLLTPDQQRRGKWAGGRQLQLPTLNYELSENCPRNWLFVEKVSSKNAKFGAKDRRFKSSPLWEQIGVLCTHNLLCRKFSVSVGKLQLFVPPTFLTRYSYAVSVYGTIVVCRLSVCLSVRDVSWLTDRYNTIQYNTEFALKN